MPVQFSSSARATLDRAQAASRNWNHEYVGQEHILFAILEPDADARCAALAQALGVDASAICLKIDGIIKPGTATGTGGNARPYTSRAHKSLKSAIAAAEELGSAEAGPEHLLIGMCDEGMGIGSQVLADAGINGAKARYAAGRMSE